MSHPDIADPDPVYTGEPGLANASYRPAGHEPEVHRGAHGVHAPPRHLVAVGADGRQAAWAGTGSSTVSPESIEPDIAPIWWIAASSRKTMSVCRLTRGNVVRLLA